MKKLFSKLRDASLIAFLMYAYFVSDTIKTKTEVYIAPKAVPGEYNFLLPKTGRVQDMSDYMYTKLIKDEYLSLELKSGYTMSSSITKNMYLAVKPSTADDMYFVNGYLTGYVPYDSENLWIPLEHLRTTLKYELDNIDFKREEVWQTSKESILRTKGDCEDHAILLCDWLIGLGYDARIASGEVKFPGQKIGGHAWVVLFRDNKEYILETTQKTKFNITPLASALPYYYPKYMFNRESFWVNTGSKYTVKYNDKKWVRSGRFVPDDTNYPDLKRLSLK